MKNPNEPRKSIIVDVIDPQADRKQAERSLDELRSLITTLGDVSVVSVIQKRGKPSGETYVGTGKAQEILNLAKELKVDQIIFNAILSPLQIKHLLDIFPVGYEVLDRVELILKIFRKHAQTDESRLQIELAETKYLLPRLRDKSGVMSRLGGGIGTRGPGEQQKEFEKRNLKKKIAEIKIKLEQAQKSHTAQRESRKKSGKAMVAIVGYTNAGKSTLFRTLTKKETLVANKLFATLDTRIGRCWLPSANQEILLSDTIGFISNLPPFLVDSFQTTLAEAREADLLLHVIDFADRDWRLKKKIVENTLREIGIVGRETLNIYNKIDLTKRKLPIAKNAIGISAQNKIGLEELKNLIAEKLDLKSKW